MPKKRKQPVERYHDRVAAKYDDSYDDAYWRWHDAITWDHLKKFLPANQRAAVLDLGCGTGTWAARLAKSGYCVTCVDISHAMLDRARAKIAESDRDRCNFIHADLVDLTALQDAAFALAVAMGDPIGCTSSPPKALREIHRVLAPGGVLIATFDNRLAALEFYLEKGRLDAMNQFLKTGRTHWLTRDRTEQFDLHTYTPAQARRLVEHAGFTILDTIGKTVLPMRHHRQLLADPDDRRRWQRIEQSLHRDPASIGRASHIQLAARKA